MNSHLIALSLMVNSHPIALFLMVKCHPVALFLMVNSHPVALLLIMNSHSIALFHGKLLPHRSHDSDGDNSELLEDSGPRPYQFEPRRVRGNDNQDKTEPVGSDTDRLGSTNWYLIHFVLCFVLR